ncbi:hypothetical protein ACRALDRAFT_2029360 [Sodiomyces alcalophilus JCM 7366]|uniref:uncharacterized protein n=1 Tax=Sodiomyces alcalophilus JCM 7366 TaxID=591952 RepID=UPI0039B4B297
MSYGYGGGSGGGGYNWGGSGGGYTWGGGGYGGGYGGGGYGGGNNGGGNNGGSGNGRGGRGGNNNTNGGRGGGNGNGNGNGAGNGNGNGTGNGGNGTNPGVPDWMDPRNWATPQYTYYTPGNQHSQVQQFGTGVGQSVQAAHDTYHKWECCQCRWWNSFVNKQRTATGWVYVCRCGHLNEGCARCQNMQPLRVP